MWKKKPVSDKIYSELLYEEGFPMKKTLSVILSLVLMLSCFGYCVSAADLLPESAHNYADDCYENWNYSYPGSAKGLYVTFSGDTYVEPRTGSYVFEAETKSTSDGTVTVGDVMNILPFAFKGDYIAVYDGNGNLYDTYTGDELAGRTLSVPGSSFRITLVSDSTVNYYGFKVTSVTAIPDELFTDVYYHTEGEESLDGSYPPGYEYTVGYYEGDENFVGWSTQENGRVCYEEGEEITLEGGRIDLYPVTVDLILDKDEIFCFNNSSYYFEDNGHEGYYLSDEDARTLQLQIYKNYGLGPVPGPILSIVLATYPTWEWQGSCYGLSSVMALNHLGLIDVRTIQDTDCLYDMELDDELMSVINYYQANAATSYLTENKAIIDGTLMYAQQLKSMYYSVAEGNLCIFTFYKDTVFISAGHTILLCGAYDDAQGNHIIIVSDCNRPWNYHDGTYDKIIITPDWTDATYRGSDFGAFNWTDDFTQFTSFDIDGDGNPLDWYKTLFSHYINFLNAFVEMFRNLFA